MAAIECPSCKADLYVSGELTLVDWVHPDMDPEGKARADLLLECEECGTRLNTFVPFEDFLVIEEGG